MDKRTWGCTGLVGLVAALGLAACGDDAGVSAQKTPLPSSGPEEVSPDEAPVTAGPGTTDGGRDADAGSEDNPAEDLPPAGDAGGEEQDGDTPCSPTGPVEVCGNGQDEDCKNGVDDGCLSGKGAFQFVNGCAVFEVEAITGNSPPGDWEYRTNQPPCADAGTCSFSGEGHYVFQPGQGCGLIKASDVHLIKFPFEVESAGVFRMAWRNLEDNETDSCEGDRNNDAFASFPTTTSNAAFTKPFKVFHGGPGGEWSWNAKYDIAGLEPDKDNVCVELAAGVHELELRGRAPNFFLDKIAICRYDDLQSCRTANSAAYEKLPLSPRGT